MLDLIVPISVRDCFDLGVAQMLRSIAADTDFDNGKSISANIDDALSSDHRLIRAIREAKVDTPELLAQCVRKTTAEILDHRRDGAPAVELIAYIPDYLRDLLLSGVQEQIALQEGEVSESARCLVRVAQVIEEKLGEDFTRKARFVARKARTGRHLTALMGDVELFTSYIAAELPPKLQGLVQGQVVSAFGAGLSLTYRLAAERYGTEFRLSQLRSKFVAARTKAHVKHDLMVGLENSMVALDIH